MNIFKRFLIIMTLAVISVSTTNCTEFTKFDRPTVPSVLEIPPVDEKFQALVATLNTVNHFILTKLNETTSFVNADDGSQDKAYTSDVEFTNDDPYLDLDESLDLNGDKGTATVLTDSTVALNYVEGETATEGFKDVKARFTLDEWVAPYVAHSTWDEFESLFQSPSATVSTAAGINGSISTSLSFEIDGICIEYDDFTETGVKVKYLEDYDLTGAGTAADKTKCEAAEGTWVTSDPAIPTPFCGFEITNKFDCEFDIDGEELPFQRWMPFMPHCDVEGLNDQFACLGKNLKWNETENDCFDSKNELLSVGKIRDEVLCDLAKFAAGDAATSFPAYSDDFEYEFVCSDGSTSNCSDPAESAANPITYDKTEGLCVENADPDSPVGIFVDSEASCTRQNNSWIGGTGHCADYSLKTEEECLAIDETWVDVPPGGIRSEFIYEEVDDVEYLDTTQADPGFPYFSGLYAGTYNTTINSSDCEICDFTLEFRNFYFEQVFLEKYDDEENKFVEVFSFTYNGDVVINGQEYDINETIILTIEEEEE